MKMLKFRLPGIMLIIALIILFVAPEFADARRGGRSFGGRRSTSKSYKSNTRSKTSTARKPTSSMNASKSTNPAKRTSFGGSRMTSSKAYTSKYGTPRKKTEYTGTNAAGQQQRYVMHGYGGYGSGLMTGYMMGTTSWMWSMPFHPAFYYSRPYYVNNPDGSMGVYPPTFSFTRLLFTLIVVAIILYIIVRLIKRKSRNSRSYSQSSFS